MLKVHQALARALAENGVDTIFGLMGDGNMFMCDTFARDYDGTFVAAAHESGAALMALGYAAVSGKIGVCSVTHGPGLVNTMTALVQGDRRRTWAELVDRSHVLHALIERLVERAILAIDVVEDSEFHCPGFLLGVTLALDFT